MHVRFRLAGEAGELEVRYQEPRRAFEKWRESLVWPRISQTAQPRSLAEPVEVRHHSPIESGAHGPRMLRSVSHRITAGVER